MPKDLQKILLVHECTELSSDQATDLSSEALSRKRGIVAFANEHDISEKECRRIIIEEARKQAKNKSLWERMKLFGSDLWWLSYFGYLQDEDHHDLITEIVKNC